MNVVPVVTRLFEAALEPSRWGAALEAAAAQLRATAVILHTGPPSPRLVRITASHGLDPELVEAYNRDHIADDELLREALGRPSGTVISSRSVLVGVALERSSVYRHLLRPSGLCEVTGASFVKQPGLFAALWMARRPGSAPFSEADHQHLCELLPHLEHAVVVHARLARAEHLAELTAGAFDRVALGVVLLDALGRPILANREARRVAGERDGFAILDGGPAAARHEHTRELHEAVLGVGDEGVAARRGRGRALRLPRPSGRADYQIVVLPLPRRCQPAGGGVVAVLFITDPERSNQAVDQMLGLLFGLTDAEVRLVTRLLQGSSLTDAATALGLSRNTVHSQLASVFRKTGTRRQSELVKRVVQGLATVEGPDEASDAHRILQTERE